MVRLRIAALVAGMTLVAAGQAEARIDDVVRQALALERAGRMGDAYALLAPLAAARAGDPDFDYALGVAASDAGHAPEAVLAFQRVLAVEPGNAQARAIHAGRRVDPNDRGWLGRAGHVHGLLSGDGAPLAGMGYLILGDNSAKQVTGVAVFKK